MRRPCPLLVLAVLLGPSAWAAEADPLASPACVASLQRLDALRRQQSAPIAVEAARQQASKACLQGPAPEQALPRSPQPPVRVAPVVPAAPPSLALPPPTEPVPVQRPSVITACDATGCWDGDGRRLNRVGSELIGPRGPCVPMGATFVCP